VIWTDEMIAALRDLRQRGATLYECAERIGVCYAHTIYKARELGLAQRLNRGNVRGAAVLARR